MAQTIVAPAKINLGLEVLYKRPDGYHEINTLFYRVSEPHDVITVTRSGFFQLTCSGDLPSDSSNIMIRAAQEFEKLSGQATPRIHVHLDKHIPIGAGLGGGSSDAAAMLQILRLSSENPPHISDMMSIAAKIGADVPFFLSGEIAAQASGKGEKLTVISPPPFQSSKTTPPPFQGTSKTPPPFQGTSKTPPPFQGGGRGVVHPGRSILIVVDPAIQVSTREAYAAISTSAEAGKLDYAEWLRSRRPLREWKEHLRNDFEPEIFRRYPRLAAIKHSMYTRGADFSLMSGSGSAVYGLFEDNAKARDAKGLFEGEGLRVFLS
jgi:4-diphosphocytidyl-2-C-methyl-D-erythritol kinase